MQQRSPAGAALDWHKMCWHASLMSADSPSSMQDPLLRQGGRRADLSIRIGIEADIDGWDRFPAGERASISLLILKKGKVYEFQKKTAGG